MITKISELEKLENLISEYKTETDLKKKHICYINLIQESMKVVKKIVLGMYPVSNSVSKDDLVQVGAIGVLKAIDNYENLEKGSFKTYLTKFIKGQILHYIRDKANLIKTPRQTFENISKVKEAIEVLASDDKQCPPLEEICEYTKLPKDTVQEIVNYEFARNVISLDQNIYSNDGFETLADVLTFEDDESFEDFYANKKLINDALEKISPKEKNIIESYYFHGVSKKDIALKYEISPTQVSRIIKKTLHKLYLIIEEMTEGKGL